MWQVRASALSLLTLTCPGLRPVPDADVLEGSWAACVTTRRGGAFGETFGSAATGSFLFI